jgi:YVTN family beta-propeller protein
VANSADNTVTMIDGVSGRTITVNVGTNPDAIAVNPITNQIYVANSGSNNVSVINGATNQTISNITVGMAPTAIAVNPVTNRIFVANSGDGTVTVIRGATNLTSKVTVGTMPIALAVNPTTNHIYVANAGSNTVTVIDGMSDQTTTLAAGTSPSALSINSMTGQVYVANSGSDNASVITEQRMGVLPLATTVSAFPANATANRTPAFVLSATGSYAPTNPSILGIRYQIDSWGGAWQVAAASGTSFTANTSALQLGPHVIYAVADNGEAAASTGLDQNVGGSIFGYFFTVVQGQTTIQVSSDLNLPSDGQSVTLTASVLPVAPATGVPTGGVRFLDGNEVLASGVALDGSGQASLTISSLAPGAHSITALYAGDLNFVNSTSSPFSQTVAYEQAAVILTSNLNPSAFGQGVTFTAKVQAVAPATGIPSGTVSFLEGNTILAGGVALNGSGQASFTTASLGPGMHSLTASYSGDSNFAASISAGINDAVDASRIILTLSKTSLTVPAGGSGNFSVNVSSDGALLAPVTLTCVGLPADATCKFDPSSLSPGALPAKVTVTIGANTAGSVAGVSRPRKGMGGGLWFGFALIGIVFAGFERRSHRTRMGLGIITLFLIAISLGCGSGTKATVTVPPTATPSVSAVTVTASSGSLQATANISVTVMP